MSSSLSGGVAAGHDAAFGTPLRVRVADDSFLLREGLCQLLALSPRIVVVGQHGDAASLLAAVDQFRPGPPPDLKSAV